MSDHLHTWINWVLDHMVIRLLLEIASVFSIASAIAGWLPPLAAILGIGWYAVLFYDRFFGRDKNR